MDNNAITVISLFSGCGGLDLGLEGNFQVHKNSINENIQEDLYKSVAFDSDSDFITIPKTRFINIFANDILRSAKAAWIPYFIKRDDIQKVFIKRSIVDLVKDYYSKGKKEFPNADIVTGGFPCQDFSVAGRRLGFNSHKGHHGNLLTDFDNPTEENRGKLYFWMREVVNIVRPKLFIAENVKGLVSLSNVRQVIESDFSSIGGNGYLVISKVLRAADYGVPQLRDRIVFLGFNKSFLKEEFIKSTGWLEPNSDLYPFPEISHVPIEKWEIGSKYMKYVTVKDALSGLLEPSKSSDLTQKSYSRAKWYGKGLQGQIEIDLSNIGPTIRAEHHGNIEFRRLSLEHGGKHLDELKKGFHERRLSVRECARLQTFPDDFQFVRDSREFGEDYTLSMSDGYKLIGNAVPPLLGFRIGWRIQKIWDYIF